MNEPRRIIMKQSKAIKKMQKKKKNAQMMRYRKGLESQLLEQVKLVVRFC